MEKKKWLIRMKNGEEKMVDKNEKKDKQMVNKNGKW